MIEISLFFHTNTNIISFFMNKQVEVVILMRADFVSLNETFLKSSNMSMNTVWLETFVNYI